MATIVNNPATSDTSTNTGMIVGILLFALLLFALLFYGANNWSRGFGGIAPSQSSGQTNVNEAPQVPDKVDVNVNPGTGTNGQ